MYVIIMLFIYVDIGFMFLSLDHRILFCNLLVRFIILLCSHCIFLYFLTLFFSSFFNFLLIIIRFSRGKMFAVAFDVHIIYVYDRGTSTQNTPGIDCDAPRARES